MDVLEFWPIILCVLQICAYFVIGLFLILLHEFPRRELKEELNEVDDYTAKVTEKPQVLRREAWEAWAGALYPGWLLGLRVVAFLYLMGLLIIVYNNRADWFHVFFYYTEWTLALLILYFGWGSLVSIFEFQRNLSKHQGPSDDAENGELQSSLLGPDQEDPTFRQSSRGFDKLSSKEAQQEQAGYLGYSLQILFQTVAPAVLLTDGIYWTFLFPFFREDFPHTFTELNLHAINFVFLTAELFLNSMRFPWFRAAYFFMWSCLYVFFQWSIHAFGLTDAPWPYPFMEVSTAYSPFWYLAVGILHISAYAVIAFLNRLKLVLQERDTQISSTARWWSVARSLWPGGVS